LHDSQTSSDHASMPNGRRFILLDRDGTINVDRDYISDPDQLELIPGVGPALARLAALGCGLVVVTNQSGIGRGYYDQTALAAVHARLEELLAAEGVRLDGIFSCPHAPSDHCTCRKPATGLVEQAVARFGFDPKQSAMLGDKAADVELGQRVGARTFLVRTGYGAETEQAGKATPDYVVDDLPAAVPLIEKLLFAR